MTPAAPLNAARITTRQIALWLGPGDWLAMLATAACAFGLACLWQGWLAALLFVPLGAAVAAIVVIDLRHFRIPDRLSLPLIPLGLIHAALTGPVWPRLLAMAAVWAGLTLLQRVFQHLRGKSGLGGGDVKLITAAAAGPSLEVLPFYVLAASVSALMWALALGANRNRRLAFGAHLAPWLLGFALFA